MDKDDKFLERPISDRHRRQTLFLVKTEFARLHNSRMANSVRIWRWSFSLIAIGLVMTVLMLRPWQNHSHQMAEMNHQIKAEPDLLPILDSQEFELLTEIDNPEMIDALDDEEWESI
jgi:hypothetical protein